MKNPAEPGFNASLSGAMRAFEFPERLGSLIWIRRQAFLKHKIQPADIQGATIPR